MPLARDEKGGGTNANGSKSSIYCSHCYEKGKFVLPKITLEEMQARVKEKLTQIGMPKIVATLYTKRIPRLERWRKSA